MLTAMAVAAAGCVALALVPTVLGPALSRIVSTSAGTPAPIGGGGVMLRLDDIGSSLSPLWIAAALTGGLLVSVVAVRSAAAGIARRRQVALWDCGAGAPTARMQYTATSFAEPVQRVFDDVLARAPTSRSPRGPSPATSSSRSPTSVRFRPHRAPALPTADRRLPPARGLRRDWATAACTATSATASPA